MGKKDDYQYDYLYDLLDIDDEMKQYVTNDRLNLYDCHEHDTFEEYHTGLRQLFEVIRYGRDKEQLQRIVEEHRETYINMDSDTRELLEEFGQVPPQVAEMISSQDSIDVLSRWLKTAAKAESIAEFEANM